jgi:CRISP-associated protein Cas1
MFFRKKPVPTTAADTTAADEPAQRAGAKRISTADTAHLVGPGCVRLEGGMPVWQPVQGSRLQLHPQYLQRVLCYGNVDFSTAVLRQFWSRGIQVVFLSSRGSRLLGKLQPSAGAPNLPRLQHLAACQPAFRLSLAREIVAAKIESSESAVRYFQQQGKGATAGAVLKNLKPLRQRADSAATVDALRGIEGSAAACWFRFLSDLLPAPWQFAKRSAHPPADRTNALLSLGYTLALSRCETLLAAADLDPRVGFLHDVHPGRPSLACDLVESLRVPLVDRLVVQLIVRNSVTLDSFEQRGDTWRLDQESFKKYLAAFEQAYDNSKQTPTFKEQTLRRIDSWVRRIRQFDTTNGGE